MSPAHLCHPLPCQWLTSRDMMQDRGSVPGPGVLKAGPAVLALPCPKKGDEGLDRGSGDGWRSMGGLKGEGSNNSSLERRWRMG